MTPDKNRYIDMSYRRLGDSGLQLPAISLGLWHNFSATQPIEISKEMIFSAFDRGITHFDLANNYGPPAGSAEITMGRILDSDLRPYRDELIISTKAGHEMWSGPYGDWGSRKSLISSLDQSLKRLQIDYVDIFYSHRYDPQTNLEETMCALDQIVRSGKALYVGLSKYPAEALKQAIVILKELKTPLVSHQVRYSMLVRGVENNIFDIHEEEKLGCVSFSPLAQGMLSPKYLNGIPESSRAKEEHFLKCSDVEQNIETIKALNQIAVRRNQTLSQMAIAWQLHDNRVTSVIMGISAKAQLEENILALKNTTFTSEELSQINRITSTK